MDKQGDPAVGWVMELAVGHTVLASKSQLPEVEMERGTEEVQESQACMSDHHTHVSIPQRSLVSSGAQRGFPTGGWLLRDMREAFG
jgi:hypothetical protein